MEQKLIKTHLSSRPTPQSVLIGITSFCLLLYLFWMSSVGIITEELLSTNGREVFVEKKFWKLFTTSLVHADVSHLGSNAFFFTGLAILLNHYFGFFIFPIISFLVGGLINIVVFFFYPPEVRLVGISGVIYFMAAFWLVLYIGLERQRRISERIIISIGMGLIFLFPEVFDLKVSYLAHGVGFIFGIAFGLAYYLMMKKTFREKEVWIEKIPSPLIEDEDINYESSEFY